MTYGDGVADVDIDRARRVPPAAWAARDGHRRSPARLGSASLDIDGIAVTRFSEKLHADAGWINGGFFVLEPGVMDYIDDDATIWEREPLERLAADGQLAAYQHEGFWQPMDTLRDRRLLEELWASGNPPWRTHG